MLRIDRSYAWCHGGSGSYADENQTGLYVRHETGRGLRSGMTNDGSPGTIPFGRIHGSLEVVLVKDPDSQ